MDEEVMCPQPKEMQEKFARMGWGEWIPTPGVNDEDVEVYLSDNREGDNTQFIHMYAMSIEEALALSDEELNARLYAIMDNPAEAIAEYERRKETHYGDIYIDYRLFFHLLHRALMLPENYHVWGCDEGDGKVFRVFVESDDIPHVEDGKPRPLVTPVYHRNEDETDGLLRIDIEGVKS